MQELIVERVFDGKNVTHFRCGGCTVRVGLHGVYACLSCRRVDCVHAEAVRAFDKPETVSAA